MAPKKKYDDECPECGIWTDRVREFDRMLTEKNQLGQRFKQVYAEHAQQIAEWEIRDIQLTESMKWLQRKTRKQAAVIRRLEEKLRNLGEQPYAKNCSEGIRLEMFGGESN